MTSHPSKIGKYNIEGVIGRGGMGVVYKAVDAQMGRFVAIKMINSVGDESALDRFKSEARSTGSLQCPNIVTVYDFGEQDGCPYLVMQLLAGSSLEAMIQKKVPLTLAERLGIIIDVCNGLAYAHQHGVIHRDIKPGNIMVLQDGVNDGMGVIVDFGIARIAGDTRLTRADQIIGSIHYMSVEQLQSLELDSRSDIYSTGVVLFQLLTGALPFDTNEPAATLLRILNEPPPPLSAYLTESPLELEAIISRVLAKKREDRYPTARELALDLMQVQEKVKSETVGQLVIRAEAAVVNEDWAQAREQLQQVLRIDRYNTRAQKLITTVHERIRRQQEIERAREMRTQADEAYMAQRYDDALHLLGQGLAIDENNNDLLSLRDTVRAAQERATGLRRAIGRAEAALKGGDLDAAQGAVEDAFKIDPNNTQAKALKVIISKHAEERSRQEQLRNLLNHARGQIAARDLVGAFATVQAAEAIDPTATELQSVVKLAASARAQERLRSETEELGKQIEAALVEEDYASAVAKAEAGLRKFPQEESLLKLKALAETQQLRVEQKKFVREQFASASSLADSGQLLQALAVLDNARLSLPANSELEALRSTIQERIKVQEQEVEQLAAQAIAANPSEARQFSQESRPDAKPAKQADPGEAVATLAPKASSTPPEGVRQTFRVTLKKPTRWAAAFAGHTKYIAIALSVVVLAVASYLIFGRHKKTSRSSTASVEIHIDTNPPDASITSDSKPLPNRTVSLIPGASVLIEIARLGYKTKQVEIRQGFAGNIVLEPEPLHLSIQTSEKSGTLELDGQKISDLSDGNLDEYDIALDGKDHTLTVNAEGKQLFSLQLHAVPGSPPQVNAFAANDLFLITSLGTNAKLYAGTLLRNVRFGEQNIAVASTGVDLNLTEQNREIKFGEGNEQGSLAIEIANVPTLIVHATNVEGQVQVTSNAEGATLTVDGVPVKHQRPGWQVRRPPGKYRFALSAEGYETQKWTITMQRRQTLTRNVDLKAKVAPIILASLLISGGTPGAEVEVDGKRGGALDANGSLQLSNALAPGQHLIGFTKAYYDTRAVEVSAKSPEARISDIKLTPWPTLTFENGATNVNVKYQRVGDSQMHETTSSGKLKLAPGQYDLTIDAPGFQKYTTQLKLVSGADLSLPLKLIPVTDYEFQNSAQVIHDGPWVRSKDSHGFVFLKPGFLHENLVFTKPGKNLFWNKKVEWVIESAEGSSRVQYVLEGQKMTRKFVAGQEASDQKDAKVDVAVATDGSSLSVHIQVDGARVRVTNDKGTVLDDYTAPQSNFSGYRIGIKTDSKFAVSGK